MRPLFYAITLVLTLLIGIAVGCIFTHSAKADTPNSSVGRYQAFPLKTDETHTLLNILDSTTGIVKTYVFQNNRWNFVFKAEFNAN